MAGGGSLQGLRPGQGSTARTVEQTVDIPVPHSRGGQAGHGGLQGVSQGQGSTALCGADPVVIPVPRSGGLQGFLPRQGSTASSSSSHVRAGAVDEPFQGGFRTFHQRKKVRGWVRTRGRNWVRTLIHGLRRLMPSPWRSTTTSLWRSRSRRRRWRRVQRLALQLAFGLCGSARGSSSTGWSGQCGGVPMAIGAPSHTHGLSFTRKPQPMNNNSPRTFLTEAVEAASGPGVRWPGRRGGERKAAWCSCAEDRGRPCALQRQVPAVLRVRSDRASASVRLQRVGLSCCDAETGATVKTSRSGAVLGGCCHARRRGERSVQAALVAFLAVQWRLVRGGRRLRLPSSRGRDSSQPQWLALLS